VYHATEPRGRSPPKPSSTSSIGFATARRRSAAGRRNRSGSVFTRVLAPMMMRSGLDRSGVMPPAPGASAMSSIYRMYAVLNDMALTGPDPRHPFHVQTQIGRQGRPSARGPKSVATKPRSGRFSVMRLHACRLFQVLLAFRAESLHESPASTVPAAAKCTIDGGNGRRPPCDSERATPRSGALTGLSDGHRSADGYM
jgi:hypothetical protein